MQLTFLEKLVASHLVNIFTASYPTQISLLPPNEERHCKAFECSKMVFSNVQFIVFVPSFRRKMPPQSSSQIPLTSEHRAFTNQRHRTLFPVIAFTSFQSPFHNFSFLLHIFSPSTSLCSSSTFSLAVPSQSLFLYGRGILSQFVRTTSIPKV